MSTATAPAVRRADERATLDRPWGVAPQVSIRPEAFGALLYHFGTRRLSFLKDRRLLAVLQDLDRVPTAGDACRAAGVTDAERPAFAAALERLAATDMIRPRDEQPDGRLDDRPAAGSDASGNGTGTGVIDPAAAAPTGPTHLQEIER